MTYDPNSETSKIHQGKHTYNAGEFAFKMGNFLGGKDNFRYPTYSTKSAIMGTKGGRGKSLWKLPKNYKRYQYDCPRCGRTFATDKYGQKFCCEEVKV